MTLRLNITKHDIDGGKPFDWGKTSTDYGKYRDIYPPEFYRMFTDKGYCVKGQHVLDLGTGTGVLPRNLYSLGAEWTGTDISPEQIAEAKRLSAKAGMNISFLASPAEQLDFPDGTFDAVTACQCFWYFDHKVISPMLARMLKPGGVLILLQLMWLPFDDKIAAESEKLVLQLNPAWTGAGYTRSPLWVPEAMNADFKTVIQEEHDMPVHFTRESWHGRMRACRGVGASLQGEALAAWEQADTELLNRIAPPEFDVLHHAAMAILRRRYR